MCLTVIIWQHFLGEPEENHIKPLSLSLSLYIYIYIYIYIYRILVKISMYLAASGAPVTVKRRAVEQVNKVKILPVYIVNLR
jgi:hypothetical protein